ncbi:T9SS type A sorting domain-containing protein [bacterium BMS3Abin03]|nr:T9SS type A sorting domain-containing protein [bacterium BMS3Abin03]
MYVRNLEVYDIPENELATIVNDENSTGTYEVEFNRSKLTSGIYFYKLKNGNNV